jgi:hypothetical protein
MTSWGVPDTTMWSWSIPLLTIVDCKYFIENVYIIYVQLLDIFYQLNAIKTNDPFTKMVLKSKYQKIIYQIFKFWNFFVGKHL